MALSFASARLIMGLFFLYSFSLSNWFIRIPDVQERLALEPARLALCLLGVPIGLVCAMLFSGPLVEKLGPRLAIRLGFLILLVPLLLPGLASSPWMLFVALLLVGLGMGPLEVSMNVAADRIGTAIGRTVMSRCHGFWSLGLMAGGITGSAAATFGLATAHHMAIVVAAMLVASQLLALRLPQPFAAGIGRGWPEAARLRAAAEEHRAALPVRLRHADGRRARSPTGARSICATCSGRSRRSRVSPSRRSDF